MPVKNMEYEIEITGLGSSGEGVGRIDGFTMFVEQGLPGDRLIIKTVKIKKTYGYGKLIKILEPSPDRVEPPCQVFKHCGGCSLLNLSYEAQLEYKTKKVAESLLRIGGFSDVETLPAIGMDAPDHYRNKAQFPVGLSPEKTVAAGFYSTRSHRLVPVSDCFIQHPVNKTILTAVEVFMNENNISTYDEKSHRGLVRHVVTRVGFTTGQIMVCIVINGSSIPKSELLTDRLAKIPGMTSVLLNRNKEKTNVILSGRPGDTKTLWGENFITDYIGSMKFEISPLSFFQVNPVQTKILYEKTLELAAPLPTDTVLDAYCGIGTISCFVAPRARKVYGVEVIPEAIDDARRNAALNGISNAEFFLGDAADSVPKIFADGKYPPPDIVILDPPRKGCDPSLPAAVASLEPKRVVYVSCDPATLARDLKILCADGRYRIDTVQPVDCFPGTWHVECVVLMSRVE